MSYPKQFTHSSPQKIIKKMFLIILSCVFLLISCTSTPENFVEQKAPTFLHILKSHIKAKCITQKGNGGFSGYIKFSNSQLLQMNTIFKNNYSYMETEIISPLGESFANIKINNKKLKISENVLASDQMNLLTTVAEETGGLFIREILCGSAFFPDFSENVYVSTTSSSSNSLDASVKSDQFYTSTRYAGAKRKYYFESYFTVASNNIETSVTVNSKITTGFFRTPIGIFSWKATITPQAVIPHEFHVSRDLLDIFISFSDFD